MSHVVNSHFERYPGIAHTRKPGTDHNGGFRIAFQSSARHLKTNILLLHIQICNDGIKVAIAVQHFQRLCRTFGSSDIVSLVLENQLESP